jgi:membrane protease YdiL (CAAX protease family)
MHLGASLLAFGIPTAVFFGGFHVVMPALIAGGMLPFNAFMLAMGVPLLGLLTASLVAYRAEGRRLNWDGLKRRFRLHRLSLRLWLATIGAFAVMLLLTVMALGLCQQLIAGGLMPIVEGLPTWLDPAAGMPGIEAMDEAFGGLSGNWFAVAAFLGLLVVNIVGEEFWWRGYVLPRQELAFGKAAWLVHGFMWAIFHAFKWWHILGLLPLTLGISLLCSRTKNTTPGIIIHLAFNSLGVIPILVAVLS